MKYRLSLSVIFAVIFLFFASLILVMNVYDGLEPELGPIETEEVIVEENDSYENPLLALNIELPSSGQAYEYSQVSIKDGDKELSGTLYKPQNIEKCPLIVASYGLGGNKDGFSSLGKSFASTGYAFVAFNYRGNINSQTDSSQISVLNEVEDLLSVLKEVKDWDFVDQIVLLGQSQGGLVSAIAAAEVPEVVDAMILEFPAFNLSDIIRFTFEDESNLSDFKLHTMELSKKYAEDLYHFKPFEEIGDYTGPVLILHGSEDPIVPLLYSQQASTVYENCTLVVIPEAGHGFPDPYYQEAFEDMLRFLIVNDIEKVESPADLMETAESQDIKKDSEDETAPAQNQESKAEQ